MDPSLSREDVLQILSPELRKRMYTNAKNFFSEIGSNGVETINIEFMNCPGVMGVVLNVQNPRECTIAINLDLLNQNLKLVVQHGLGYSVEEVVVSFFSHEVGHAHGHLSQIDQNGLLSIHSGIDYRLADSGVTKKSVAPGIENLRSFFKNHVLTSGSVVNELLTDFLGRVFVEGINIGGEKVRYLSGYDNEKAYGNFLMDFVGLVAKLRGLSTQEILDEFLFAYSQGELLDSQLLFYSKLPSYLPKQDRDFFYMVLTVGYAELFDPRFMSDVKSELSRMRKKYLLNQYE